MGRFGLFKLAGYMLVGWAISVAVSACTSYRIYHPPLEGSIDSSFLIEDQSFDQTWASIIELLAHLDYPINLLDKPSGFIQVGWLTSLEAAILMDCGVLKTYRADGKKKPQKIAHYGFYDYRFKFNVVVRASTEGARVIINSWAYARKPTTAIFDSTSSGKPMEGGILDLDLDRPVRCFSNGRFENLLIGVIRGEKEEKILKDLEEAIDL